MPDPKNSSIYISTDCAERDILKTVRRGSFETVIYDDLGTCGNAPKCTVEICSQNHWLPLASITLDMNNKLKLVNTVILEPYLIKILHAGTFNNINIEESDIFPPPPSSWLKVSNNINPSVLAVIQNVIITDEPILTQDEGRVFFEAALEECRGGAECAIDFRTSQGGMIGSVVVDMENDMNILQVSSFRPSEIIVKQTDANMIEIKYPYLNKE